MRRVFGGWKVVRRLSTFCSSEAQIAQWSLTCLTCLTTSYRYSCSSNNTHTGSRGITVGAPVKRMQKGVRHVRREARPSGHQAQPSANSRAKNYKQGLTCKKNARKLVAVNRSGRRVGVTHQRSTISDKDVETTLELRDAWLTERCTIAHYQDSETEPF